MENTHAPDDEIDLLDLLVTIAENIKLLVLGPLVAGLNSPSGSTPCNWPWA
jgi:hypothetical protein